MSMNQLRSASPGDNSRRPLPAAGNWSEAVTRREPQSPLWVAFSGPAATLRVSGVIDESTRTLFTAALTRAAASTQDSLRIDMSRVTFCDLAGLRAIVSLAAQQAPAKRITLAGLPQEAATILCILGWNATTGLAVLPARPHARTALGRQPSGRAHSRGHDVRRC
jgi:anti-anti-sigma regulatory factor